MPTKRESDLRFSRQSRNMLVQANQLYWGSGEAQQRALAYFDLEWGLIRAGQAWAATHTHDDDEAARLCSAYPDGRQEPLHLRQPSTELIRWLEAAIDADRRLGDRAAEGR